MLAELAPQEAVALLAALVFQVRGRSVQCVGAEKWWFQICSSSALHSLASVSPPLQEKTDCTPELPPRLAQACEEATALALAAGAVQQECGLQLTPDEFAAGALKFGLSEVGCGGARLWCRQR